MIATAAAVAETSASATITLFYLLIPALILYFVYWKLQRKRFLELAEKIPGPKGYPIIGHGLSFLGSTLQFTDTLMGFSFEYTNLMKLWIFHKLLVFIAEPRDVELILGNSTHLEKSEEYRFFKPWLGDGLLISSGEKWKSHLKIIAPTFHLNVLKSFVDLFNVNSRAVCEKIAKENGKPFDCHDYMSECTVEILLETAMGVSKKTQNTGGYEYAMAVMKQSKLWLRPDWLFSLTNYGKEQVNLLGIIHGLTKKVIKRKKEKLQSDDKTFSDSSVNPQENSVSTVFKALKDDLDEQDENYFVS